MRKTILVFLWAGLGMAALEGTSQTTPPPAQDSTRFPNREAEPPPDFPPSYQVHISPTSMEKPGTSTAAGRSYWVARGWDLKSMIGEVYHVDRSRLDVPSSLDDGKRYDFAMVLPKPESEETIYDYVRQAIQTEFHLRIETEAQLKDVYVLTAPNGLSPAVKILPKVTQGGWGSGMGVTDNSISAHGITMDQLCRMLERLLGRLIVDETHIEDRFDVKVQGSGHGKDALIGMLREQLGLALTPDHRDVPMLVVR